jgi:hypothetical protein
VEFIIEKRVHLVSYFVFMMFGSNNLNFEIFIVFPSVNISTPTFTKHAPIHDQSIVR